MKSNLFKIAHVAGIALALALTISCSGGDNDNNGGGGGGTGGGVQFNENSQIYYENGTLFKGNGILEVADGISGDGDCNENGCEYHYYWNGMPAGSVTNGIVSLNLPSNIPNEYLWFFDVNDDRISCSSYSEGIKIAFLGMVLTNDNKDYLGELAITYEDEQIKEAISYMYSSKAGKITCNKKNDIYNIDAKIGWNKVYGHKNYTTGTGEISTNNILTKEKEVKWIIYDDR